MIGFSSSLKGSGIGCNEVLMSFHELVESWGHLHLYSARAYGLNNIAELSFLLSPILLWLVTAC
jgi:hypothetical protein